MDQPDEKAKKEIPKLGKDQIYVKIYAPFKVYYDGIAKNITATNDTGKFDVLAEHHNFITILNAGETIVRDDQGEHVIDTDAAIMHVKGNQVVVFVNV
jgi:F0F1-type ATP synthase epsilon subunit